MNRFVKAVSLLTLGLFLLSASIDVALDRVEHASGRSQLMIYTHGGNLVAVYHGNLRQLAAVGQAVPATKMPLYLHHGRTAGTPGQTGWL
jgi:hypothetical protein